MIALKLAGRLGVAPCGHPGQVVIGAYVECLAASCDGTPGEKCRQCGSGQLEPFSAPFIPEGAIRCVPCGKVWWGGVEESDD